MTGQWFVLWDSCFTMLKSSHELEPSPLTLFKAKYGIEIRKKKWNKMKIKKKNWKIYNVVVYASG